MEGFGVKIFFNVVVVGFLFQLLEVALARGGGFSVDLIHRDSPHSPFFDPSKTQAERLTDAFRRSVSRVGRFRPTAMTPDGIQSRIVPSAGEYLMNFSIGTPPVPVIAIVDTGSDLTWTQCRPCTHCYKQVVPLFDPKKSSTYRDSSCGTSFCLALGKDRSCRNGKKCTFMYSYADGSFTGGNLAVETLTVASTAGKPVSFPGFAFGCGHKSGGIFDKSSSGIHLQQDKFWRIRQSLRLRHRLHSASSESPDTFYYLTLEGISVGKKRLPYKGFSKKAEVEEGNIIVDSGTTYTFLPQEFYSKLEKSVANSIKGKRVRDPNGIFSLCYNTTAEINAPIITAHFKDANVKLQPLNTFMRMQEDLVCFTVAPTSDIGVLGNLAQVNFLVGFDLRKKRVSFKAADCTQH
ncbi:aspartic proteinase CDR1-like [Vitis riparia]|uniref:aspartic proteinase CDR1-like n=1 Tax=Vitis riparia TaxID=96939 RepID=UPI00155B172C|nr:aspartic proteinase CDR1-like [Vitis riparia]